jgi:regulator of cell morphogenesis and NO signaling
MAIEIGRKTVRDAVLETPAAARIFEDLGIDYCCGGEKLLIQACAEAKISLEGVGVALAKPALGSVDHDWRNVPLTELAQFIVDKHHCGEIQRLIPLISEVVSVHRKNRPELLQVQSLFPDLAEELTMHMTKEEQVLFPYIAEMDKAGHNKRPLPRAMFGTVESPVRMMVSEHDSSGRVLHELRNVTNGYVSPWDGCATYEALCCGLGSFEKDLHNHIHLENNILFPRAIDLERAAA